MMVNLVMMLTIMMMMMVMMMMMMMMRVTGIVFVAMMKATHHTVSSVSSH